MSIDEEVVDALKRAVFAAKKDAPRPIPAEVLAPLMKVARPGLHMRLDTEASEIIGAPLIFVSETADVADLLSPLTKRQKEIAFLIIEGLSNRSIADQLGISVATVKDHVHAILDRLDLPSRTALVSRSRTRK